ncbi:hypothetical protein I316_01530 [Kwoniella heveanensis BCC8398]|uniref:Uncharacterized protein n=1 Tax=Kwoniella heveanensis BCC8398 TaxID=1296120 RepID=A0A1B9H0X8_9TREE|nr:hypothetical protein I316_01530 [Kwoniella heveanensis BCC8398]
MPHITQSPLSSPSLRSIAHHAHPHGPVRASYFPPVPNAPHVYHHRVPPTPQSSLNIIHHSPQPNLGSSLVGCLKHTQHISSRPARTPSSASGSGVPHAHARGPAYSYGNESMASGGSPYHTGEYNAHHATGPQPHQTPIAHGYHAQSPLRPAMKSTNPQEKRRVSTGVHMGMENLKISNIPLGPSSTVTCATRGMHTSATANASVRNGNVVIPAMEAAVNATTTGTTGGKRRPSFKIELPPRPVAAASHHQHQHLSQLQHQYQSPGHTPGSRQQQQQQHVAPSPASAAPHAHSQPQQYTMPQPISFASPTPGGQQLPVFIDPFPNPTYSPSPVGGYVILRAPTRGNPGSEFTMNSNFFDDFPSPTHITRPAQSLGLSHGQMQLEMEMEGVSGLGYSLNRLRAPTPWLRGKAADKALEEQEEDDEWIRAEELESGLRDVEQRVRGLGVA